MYEKTGGNICRHLIINVKNVRKKLWRKMTRKYHLAVRNQ